MRPGIERKTHHQRVVERRDLHAMLRQHRHVIFEIVADLQHRIVGKQRTQRADQLIRCGNAVDLHPQRTQFRRCGRKPQAELGDEAHVRLRE